MKDLTKQCLEDLQKNLQKPVAALELRSLFCVRCHSSECGNAQARPTDWESRMKTQEDRLLNQPNFADHESSRYETLRAIDFPDTIREVLSLAANSGGSWDPPDEDLSGKPKVKYQDVDQVEQAMRALRQSAPDPEPDPEPDPSGDGTYEVEVASKSSAGIVYTVQMRDGKALSCTCAGWQHRQRCVHLKWAEGQETVSEPTPETPSEELAPEPVRIVEPTKRARPRKGGNLPPDFARYENTPVPPHGIVLGEKDAPAGGLSKRVVDPWDPEGQTNVQKTGGLTVTVGKRKK